MKINVLNGVIGSASTPRISITANTIAENAASGSTVGVLSVQNGSGAYTFTITADPDNKFTTAGANGANLNTDASLDFETSQSHAVTIEADNGSDPAISRTLIIGVTNVFEQPELTALTLPATAARGGTISISGATSGSTITAVTLPTGWTLDGPNRQIVVASDAPLGSQSWSLIETLNDSSNSPNASSGSSTVQEASSAPLDDHEADVLAAFSTRQTLTSFSGDAVSATSNRVTSWNDQSGNSHDAAQATSARQPFYDDEGVIFEGYSNNATDFRFLTIGNSASIDRQAFSGYIVIEAYELLTNDNRILVGSGGFSIAVQDGRISFGGGGGPFVTKRPHSGKLVIGFIGTASSLTCYYNNLAGKEALSALSSGTSNLNTLSIANSSNRWNGQLHEIVFFDTALSESDLLDVMANAVSHFGVVTTPAAEVVTVGDSKTYAIGSDITAGRSWPFLLNTAANTWVYNFGVPSRRADEWNASELAKVTPVITANSDVIVSLGANDLNQGDTGAQAHTDVSAVVTTLNAASPNQIAVLTQNRSDSVATRDAFNTLVRGDTAGGDVLIDVALDSEVGITVGAGHQDGSFFHDVAHENQSGQVAIARVVDAALFP